MFRRILRLLFDSIVLLVTVAVGVPVTVAGTVLAGLLFLPLPATIPQPKPIVFPAPTVIYDRNGNQIAEFRQFDQNVPVSRTDIPTVLKEAVIAIEDRNFYQHGGVDIRGSLRAFLADLHTGSAVQGGSTITQQYVKKAFTGGQRTLVRKVREAVLASQLDRVSSKDEILYRYLSSIYLGDGGYGVGAAAENYFRIPVNQLSLSQAAMIAGLIAAPSAWAPRENPEMAETRRKLVLDKMLQQGYISRQAHDAAIAQRVWLLADGPAPAQATAVYPPLQQAPKYPAFVDYAQRWLLNRYGPGLVFGGGLRVQTTIDPRIQAAADQSAQTALKGTKSPLDMAIATIEPQTGFVAALVGGRDFGHGPRGRVNLAVTSCEPAPAASLPVEVRATCWNGTTITGGGPGRQPGSAWKPFVLAAAFAKGYLPSKVYPAPHSFVIPGCKPTPNRGCTISNVEGEGGGSTDLRHATWASINTVFAQLIRDVGCPDTAQMAKKLGILSAWYSSQFHTCSGAYALGEVGVAPLDMASGYGVFDNHGQRAEPTPILKVIDRSGKVLLDNIATKPATAAVIDPVVADNVTDVMRGVIQAGTGTAANIGRPAAGKTGTTSNFTNAWFVGYTPTLSTAVWMGYADNQKTPLRNIDGVSQVFGGTIPAQVWHNLMTQALAGVSPTDFSQPAPIQTLSDRLNNKAHPPPPPITPGGQRSQPGTPSGGPYQYGPPEPRALPPTTTTTTTTTTTSVPPPGGTTTTSNPP
jgi:penicillin-binding protein 1A